MRFLFCVVVLGTSVFVQSLNPRSVNVALETVLEFDGKHNYRDVKAIDKLQDYLSRIKNMLSNNDTSRRHFKGDFKFTDFLKLGLETVKSYDDNDLLDVVAIVNNEIRKYHYKGCRFHELVENQNFRRDMAANLLILNELTAKELRSAINKAVDTVDNGLMSEKKKSMLDYLDSLYVGDDIKNKMEKFLTDLEQFKKRSKRASLNLVRVVRNGIRAILFDYYSNLNSNARKELRNRLENFWHELKRVKIDVWRIPSKASSDRTLSVKSNIYKGIWKIITTFSPPTLKKSINGAESSFEILNTKKSTLRKRPTQKKKESKKRFHTAHKRKEITPEEDSLTYAREKTHHDKFRKHHKRRNHKTTTPADESSDDAQSSKSSNAQDSSTEKEKRKFKKIKRKQKRLQRTDKEPTFKVYLKKQKHKSDVKNLDESKDLSKSTEITKFTKSMRKQYHSTNNNVKLKNITSDNSTTPPIVLSKIDRIEKVLDEIKNIVSLKETTKAVSDIRRYGNDKILQSNPVFIDANDRTTQNTMKISSTTKVITKRTETTNTYSTPTAVTTSARHLTLTIPDVAKNTSQKHNIADIITIKSTNIEEDTRILTEKSTILVRSAPNLTTKDLELETTTKSNANITISLQTTATQTENPNPERRSAKDVRDEYVTVSNSDIEQMINETQGAVFDNIIDKNSSDHQELSERLEGHMNRLLSVMTEKGNYSESTKPFDFSLDNPFKFNDHSPFSNSMRVHVPNKP